MAGEYRTRCQHLFQDRSIDQEQRESIFPWHQETLFYTLQGRQLWAFYLKKNFANSRVVNRFFEKQNTLQYINFPYLFPKQALVFYGSAVQVF